MATAIQALGQAKAFANTDFCFHCLDDGTADSQDMANTLKELSEVGIVEQRSSVGKSVWQFTRDGQRALQICVKLCKPQALLQHRSIPPVQSVSE